MNLAFVDRIWFLTWTTYGTWLPGDDRGFVSPKFEGEVTERRNNRPGTFLDRGRSELKRLAANRLKGEPVRLSPSEAELIHLQFEETSSHRGWTLLAGAIMSNHVHLLVGVPGDPDPSSLIRDYKSYSSRALNSKLARPANGTWWTEQGSKRKITNWETIEIVLNYIRDQFNPLRIWECRQQAWNEIGANRKFFDGPGRPPIALETFDEK